MRLLAAVLGALFVVFHAFPAGAQAACGDRDKFVVLLGENYAERAVAIGLTASGRVLEVFTALSGTWTILVTYPNGVTCVVATGESWEALPTPESGEVS
ncbi:MAG: hypothetical protein ACE5LF_01500 [Alphaproteobacteria bacterium]